MSRREEVEVELGNVWGHRSPEEIPVHLNQIARTLADEIDALHAVVTKLLAMLTPGAELGATMIEVDALEQLAAANATLDALREVVPNTFTTENSHIWRKSLYKVRNILYPPMRENDL